MRRLENDFWEITPLSKLIEEIARGERYPSIEEEDRRTLCLLYRLYSAQHLLATKSFFLSSDFFSLVRSTIAASRVYRS